MRASFGFRCYRDQVSAELDAAKSELEEDQVRERCFSVLST